MASIACVYCKTRKGLASFFGCSLSLSCSDKAETFLLTRSGARFSAAVKMFSVYWMHHKKREMAANNSEVQEKVFLSLQLRCTFVKRSTSFPFIYSDVRFAEKRAGNCKVPLATEKHFGRMCVCVWPVAKRRHVCLLGKCTIGK